MRDSPLISLVTACLALFALSNAAAGDASSVQIRGQGWTQMGRLMKVTDTLGGAGVNLNGNWLQSNGAQFTAFGSFGENLEGAFGFGGYQVYHSQGNAKQQRTMRFVFQNYITEARLTYYQGDKANPGLSLTFGNFSYNYNRDAKDLGSYLLRGPVYPGYLQSGFREFATDTTKGNVLGGRLHHAIGNFQQDLIFANERELPPTFDWSVAYVARYKAFDAVEVGAGVNFYRLLPADSKFETVRNVEARDTSGNFDTVSYSNQGTKLMTFFNVDLKRWIPASGLGRGDLRLYGEAALLGVKNQGIYYNDRWKRIPVMIGFNFPTFGLLDYLSLEVEWYGSKYRNSLANIGNFNSLSQPGVSPFPVEPLTRSPSPIPLSYEDYYKNFAQGGGTPDAEGNLVLNSGDTLHVTGNAWDVENLMTDNWKWALYLEKTVHQHVTISGQIANDHFRPRPAATAINEQGGMAEAFTSPKDWYFMFRTSFFF